MRKFCIFLVERVFGWHYVVPKEGERPELQHCVMIVAPHTAIDDFFLGITCLWKMNVEPHIFMKKEFFNFFTRRLLRRLGVIAVDRGNPHNGLVDKAVDMFNTNERFTLTITPEGTRKKVNRWKRGFYDIAIKANVPIVLAFIDFKKKEMGVGPVFQPTGDFKADLPKIMAYYEGIGAKYPEKFTHICTFSTTKEDAQD